MSAQAEAGNVKIVRGPWNDDFLRVLENFPTGRHDDEVDARSGAHQVLCPSCCGFWSASQFGGGGPERERSAYEDLNKAWAYEADLSVI